MRRKHKRLLGAALLALVLHLFFLFIVAPYWQIPQNIAVPTDVVQISAEQLAELKQKILKNKFLPPLLKEEMHEKYRSKTPPKNAKMMGAFNQEVPEEIIAGAQSKVPQPGQGTGGPKAQKLTLSKLGLGAQVPRPKTSYEGATGPPTAGPPQPEIPVGRESSDLKHGSKNLLNAVENEYYSFFVRFEEPIIRNWFYLVNSNSSQIREELKAIKARTGDEIPVVVEFSIDRMGGFQAVSIIESSRLPTLDWATKQAVLKLKSLPNPPPGLFEGKAYFVHRLAFAVRVVNQPVVVGSPRLDWY